MSPVLKLLGASLGVVVFVGACSELMGPTVDEQSGFVLAPNGLGSNGLASNGLISNGLASNGLISNGLASNTLAPTTLTALRDTSSTGELTRTFFSYLVSCALGPTKSVTYTYTDSAGVVHAVTNSGIFNLAPRWETGPLDLNGQQWVSACLFARVNAMGISVPISMRGNGVNSLAVTEQERRDFPYGEGAFWGNIFAPTPYGFSCSGGPLQSATASSSDLKNGRSCASAGCGLIKYVGPCYKADKASTGQACFARANNNDWVQNCTATMTLSKGMATQVISTSLRP